jgi:hypothetical protein
MREPVCALRITNGAKKLVLQAPNFHWMGICRNFPGVASISHYTPNECFVDGQFNVSS